MSIQSRKSVVVLPGEGYAVWSVGDRMTFKVRSEHTACDFVLLEMSVVPGGGPPPHVHLREDEMFYVLDGEVTFLRDEATFAAGPGSAVFMPRGTVHTFTNRTDRPARALVWASPSNFEAFMMEFGVPCDASPTAPPFDGSMLERLLKAADRYGLEILLDHKPMAFLAPPMPAKPMPVLGQRVTLKLIGKHTRDRMCAALLDVAPGPGVLPHLHRREDELFYVTAGTLEFRIDGARHVCPTGTTLYVPRGTFHGFHAVGGAPAQVLSVHTPAGFEHFFTEMGGLTVCGVEPQEPAALVRMLNKHGMEVPV
jgi:quercetin dioxygenase-like cupin family protein